MVQERQHLQSTKTQTQKDVHPIIDLCDKTKRLNINHMHIPSNDDHFPPSPSPNIKCNEVAYAIINRADMSVGYMDGTGRFPQRSSRGNEYILIGYHFDGNAILGQPIKNRSADTLTTAWETIHKQYETSGNSPQIYVLDNEKSSTLIQAFNKNGVTYQLVPPNNHRSNMAERAIQTFKHHFKSGLATCDPDFPLAEWDRLIQQAIITLNLLRASRTNPKISAYTHIFGEFDFKSTPLAPPGTKIVAHIKPQNRNSWDLNGAVGFYIGPALAHYRCITGYFPKTKSERVCDTVQYISNTIAIPKTNIDDYLRQSATDIIDILTKPPSSTYPSLSAGDPIRNGLLELATLLKRADPITNGTEAPAPPRVQEKLAPPRVQTTLKPSKVHEPPVPLKNHIGVDALNPINNLPKNNRFNNSKNHRYPLRSLTKHHLNLASTSLSHRDHFIQSLNHIYDPKGKRLSIDKLLESKERLVWLRGLSNEWGRLANGNVFGIKGTNTIKFISRNEVPHNQDVTYATFVCDYKPLKTEIHRVRITVGGDRLECSDDTGSPAANLVETKILVNSTISDAKYGARFMSSDIVNYFLASPMPNAEYMKVKVKHLPEDIRIRYNIDDLVTTDGFVYIRIEKGMYGLKNAAILAYDNLKINLGAHGYHPVEGTVGLWKHDTKRTRFCVCVDDFGIKYFSKADAQHLLNAIGTKYKYTVDWTGCNYCGLTFKWCYEKGYVDISMPGYVKKALSRLNHSLSKSPQLSPHQHVAFRYAQKGQQQMATNLEHSPDLTPHDRQHLQSIVGTLLYYGRALEYSILPALNDIAREQATPTVSTMTRAKRVLDYVATYSDAYLRYYASDMVLHVDSDAAYLIAPQAKSRVAGFYHLSTLPSKSKTPPMNGGVLVECKTLRHVVASAAEAEIAGIFHNAQTIIPLRRILVALNHPQPPTPIKTDNSTANGFIHKNIHQKRSKSWDMRYYWLRDKMTQKKLHVFWEKGLSNNADYFTKHHPTKYHQLIRPKYIRDKIPTPTRQQNLANHLSILYSNFTSVS